MPLLKLGTTADASYTFAAKLNAALWTAKAVAKIAEPFASSAVKRRRAAPRGLLVS